MRGENNEWEIGPGWLTFYPIKQTAQACGGKSFLCDDRRAGTGLKLELQFVQTRAGYAAQPGVLQQSARRSPIPARRRKHKHSLAIGRLTRLIHHLRISSVGSSGPALPA